MEATPAGAAPKQLEKESWKYRDPIGSRLDEVASEGG
jgi:hypothetical protein